MSRFGKWNGTQDHIINKIIDKEGLSYNLAKNKTRNLIKEFAKEEGFIGSYTDKILFVRDNYSKFYNRKIK